MTQQEQRPQTNDASSSAAASAGQFSFASSPEEAGAELDEYFEEQEMLLNSNKCTVFMQYQDLDCIPEELDELFHTYAAEQGLLVSRLLQGSSVIFENDDCIAWRDAPVANPCSQQREESGPSTATVEAAAAAFDGEHDLTHMQITLQEVESTFDQYQDLSTATKSPTLPYRVQRLLIPTILHGKNRIAKGTLSECESQSLPLFDRQTRIVPKAPVFPPPSETIDTAAASMGCYTLVPLPERFRVAVVSGRHNRFSGVLPLPSTDCMLFDETCMRTFIADSKAEGGMLVCRGRGCTVSFHNVHFDNCPVIILDGAVVTFETCTFSATKKAHRQSHPSYAVLAHGKGTLVSINNCRFEHSKHRNEACVVQNGAKMHLDQCKLHAFRRASVRASGAHCKVSLRRCSIDSGPMNVDDMLASSKMPYRGVSVCQGAHGMLWGCMINDILTGVCVVNATARVHNTQIEEPEHVCLAVHSSSSVWCEGCRFMSAVDEDYGHGVMVSGSSTLSLNGCYIIGNSSSALSALEAAKVSLSNCEVAENQTGGLITAGEGVVLTVVDTVVRGCYEHGIQIIKCKELNLKRVRCVDNKNGINILIAERCNMLDCKIEGYLYTGVAICGQATATLKRVTFGPVSTDFLDQLDEFDNYNYGEPPAEKISLNIQGDVQVSADSCQILPGEGAIGAKVLGNSSKLSLSNCQMNGIYGVFVMCARLTMKDCSTSGCVIMGVRLVNASGTLTRYTSRSDQNVLGCEGSVVNAKSCQFADFSMGVSITGRTDSVSSFHDCKLAGSGSQGSLPFSRSVGVAINPGKFSVNFTKCVIRHVEDSCIVVRGMEGPLNVQDCEISESSNGCGVEVMRQSTKVVLKRCTIRHNASHGVLCAEDSHVVAERVHSTGNGKAGFGFRDGSRLKLTDCSSVRDTHGVDAVRESVAGDPPEISLRRVVVHKAAGSGVVITGAMRCDVTNCCVLQCGGVGFAAGACKKYLLASNVRLASCRAQRCGQQGVLCMADGKVTVKNTVSVRNGGAGFACCDKGSEMQLVGCRSRGDTDDFFCDDKAKLRISK